MSCLTQPISSAGLPETCCNTPVDPDLTLGEDELPAVFRAADAATAAAQHQVVRRTQLQIAALIGAAAVGALGSVRTKSGSSWASIVGQDATWIGIAAAGLLLSGAFIRLQGLGEFEKRWYEGRALAESAKTLGVALRRRRRALPARSGRRRPALRQSHPRHHHRQ